MCGMCCVLLVNGRWVMYAGLLAGGDGGPGGDALCAALYLEAVEGGLWLLEASEVSVLKVLEVPEVMRCVLLCKLEAVEGGLCLLEVLDVPEVMRCVLFFMLEAV